MKGMRFTALALALGVLAVTCTNAFAADGQSAIAELKQMGFQATVGTLEGICHNTPEGYGQC